MSVGLSLRGTAASVAPRGVSSLTCGAAVARTASGSAAFRGGFDCRAARNAAVVDAFLAGDKSRAIAKRLGITPARVSQICTACRSRRAEIAAERARRAKRNGLGPDDRVDYLLDCYNCGFSIDEVADLMGIATSWIWQLLTQHPDYVARGSYSAKGGRVPVPDWVPARHSDRYQQLAAVNGQEVAASCLRRMKAYDADPTFGRAALVRAGR